MWITHVHTAFTLFAWAVFVTKVAEGLRLLRVDVPAAVMRGDSVWLNCSFDLETDELYSVKWYKNSVEFYRYLPSDKPPSQIYDSEGVFVDMEKSEVSNVFLRKTDLYSDGVYRCEVSADAPHFQTVRKEKELRVYVFPKDDPTISGIHTQYQVGDLINVGCRSGPSKPPAALVWYINDKPASQEFEIRRAPLRRHDGLLVSTLALSFSAQPSHFRHGVIKLRCAANIYQAYSISSEELVIGDSSRAPGGFHTGSDSEGPIISGSRPTYQIGDTVNINCSSARSKPPADLQWFINDKEVRQEYLRQFSRVRYSDGQEVSVLGLNFLVDKRHFQRSEMRLKCKSSISRVISRSSERILQGRGQQSSGLHGSANSAYVHGSSALSAWLSWSTMASFLIAVACLL